MSITDLTTLEYDEKREAFWLARGTETYYDDERNMRMWNNPFDALAWAAENDIAMDQVQVHLTIVTKPGKGHILMIARPCENWRLGAPGYFEHSYDAREFAIFNFGIDPYAHLSEDVRERNIAWEKEQRRRDRFEDLPLFGHSSGEA